MALCLAERVAPFMGVKVETEKNVLITGSVLNIVTNT